MWISPFFLFLKGLSPVHFQEQSRRGSLPRGPRGIGQVWWKGNVAVLEVRHFMVQHVKNLLYHIRGRRDRSKDPVFWLLPLKYWSDPEIAAKCIDWLIDSSYIIHHSVDWLIDRMIDTKCTDRLFYWLIDWLIDWYMMHRSVDWLIDCLVPKKFLFAERIISWRRSNISCLKRRKCEFFPPPLGNLVDESVGFFLRYSEDSKIPGSVLHLSCQRQINYLPIREYFEKLSPVAYLDCQTGQREVHFVLSELFSFEFGNFSTFFLFIPTDSHEFPPPLRLESVSAAEWRKKFWTAFWRRITTKSWWKGSCTREECSRGRRRRPTSTPTGTPTCRPRITEVTFYASKPIHFFPTYRFLAFGIFFQEKKPEGKVFWKMKEKWRFFLPLCGFYHRWCWRLLFFLPVLRTMRPFDPKSQFKFNSAKPTGKGSGKEETKPANGDSKKPAKPGRFPTDAGYFEHFSPQIRCKLLLRNPNDISFGIDDANAEKREAAESKDAVTQEGQVEGTEAAKLKSESPAKKRTVEEPGEFFSTAVNDPWYESVDLHGEKIVWTSMHRLIDWLIGRLIDWLVFYPFILFTYLIFVQFCNRIWDGLEESQGRRRVRRYDCLGGREKITFFC